MARRPTKLQFYYHHRCPYCHGECRVLFTGNLYASFTFAGTLGRLSTGREEQGASEPASADTEESA